MMPSGSHFVVPLAFAILFGTGCRQRTQHEVFADSITEDFVRRHVRPLSDPVADLAYSGVDLPPDFLAANKITAVEVTRKGSDSQTVFEDEQQRPPNDGMITGVQNARNIGLFFPLTLEQPEIEVRMNYSFANDDFIAVHLVVPNPWVLGKETRN